MTDERKSSVETLLSFLKNPVNIAEELDDNILNEIGRKAVEGFEADKSSMEDWTRVIEEGLKLIKTEVGPKSEPWPNAANFKSPLIIDAGLKFGDRASSVLLRGPDFAKPVVVGNDQDGEKLKKGERVVKYMNWQLNVEMSDWVKEHNKMIYDIPYTGCVFKKTFFSRQKQSNVSELITYPSFAVNHNTTSLEKARRFTQTMEFSDNEVIERQRGGLWLDIDLIDTESTESTEEQAEDDHINTYLEQETYLDLDDDGYEEPYTITVHQGLQKVLRIVPRFEAEGVLLKDEKNQRSASLIDLLRASIPPPPPLLDEQGQEQPKDFSFIELMELGATLPATDGEREIIKIDETDVITKYGFLPNPDGGFLDIGYFHLLIGINGAVNIATNSLLNAGMLANLQGGWMSRTGRQKLGAMRMKPGVYQQTDLDPVDLQNAFRDYSFKEPSSTLFALNQFMIATGEKLSSSVDLVQSIGPNTPAATTLALIQEQEQSSGAIILRMYRSTTEEFKKLQKLNAKFLDEEQYKRVVDDPDASAADFDLEDLDIVPAANPEASSKLQRLQLAQAEMSQLQSVVEAGGDIKPIVRAFYEAIGSQQLEQIFPELTDEEKAQQQQAQQQQQQLQLELATKPLELAERETEAKEVKTAADIDKIESEIEKNEAQTVKFLEEAETENTRNLSDAYTKAIQLDRDEVQGAREAVELQQAIAQPPQAQQPQ